MLNVRKSDYIRLCQKTVFRKYEFLDATRFTGDFYDIRGLIHSLFGSKAHKPLLRWQPSQGSL